MSSFLFLLITITILNKFFRKSLKHGFNWLFYFRSHSLLLLPLLVVVVCLCLHTDNSRNFTDLFNTLLIILLLIAVVIVNSRVRI